LEEQQERVMNENTNLKHKNTELNARLELANKRTTSEQTPTSHAGTEVLKQELAKSLEENRLVNENAERILAEASKYREEAQTMV